ncbi:hypothetical protein WOB81_17150 [Vibrio parahaemolyticus]|nr:hypothetical protein [Vibrio vulnificus]HCG5530044.1 hypothetical protein [Vibrio parahaemolyticus]
MAKRKMTSVAQLRRFETVGKAVEENYIRISMLKSVGGEQNIALAMRIDDCIEGRNRCNSLACKLCNREYRLRRVDELVLKMRRSKIRKGWWVITIIDYSRAFSHKELDSFDVRKAKDRLSKLFFRCGFKGPILGCFEIDLHQSSGLWLPHFHVICPKTQNNRNAAKKLKNRLNRQQPKHIREGVEPRPYKFQKLKNPYRQISYIHKLVYSIVLHYSCATTSEIRTTKRRPKAEIYCDSLRWADRVGRMGVLFRYGERAWNP